MCECESERNISGKRTFLHNSFVLCCVKIKSWILYLQSKFNATIQGAVSLQKIKKSLFFESCRTLPQPTIRKICLWLCLVQWQQRYLYLLHHSFPSLLAMMSLPVTTTASRMCTTLERRSFYHRDLPANINSILAHYRSTETHQTRTYFAKSPY